MRTALSWWLLLVGVCVVAPYIIGVRPRTRRDWFLITGTVMFLTWLLGGVVSVRA